MVKMITGLFGIHANQLSLLLFFHAFSYLSGIILVQTMECYTTHLEGQ